MRKVFSGILATVVGLSVCAAGPVHGRCFVNSDKNGICDNYGAHLCGVAETGCSRNFVDADGNGVCDNYASGQRRGGCGCGFRGARGR